MVKAYIGLGSNLGERRANLDAAVEKLADVPGVEVLSRSRWHETSPLGGPPGQPDYLNGVVEIETALSPRAVLAHLQGIERELGRVRAERWGPRVIDCDLVLHGDAVVDEPGLTVPNPRMRERRFVLEPLAELAPGARDPVTGLAVGELLERLGAHADQAR